jgi:hypothetical protein
MDTFLTQNWPKLNHEDTDNIGITIMSYEIQKIKSSNTIAHDQVSPFLNFTKHFKN